MKTQSNFRFRNWAGNEECRPEMLFFPKSEAEIQQAVREARAAGKKVRVVGGGHSWSPVACSDEYLVSLDKCDRVKDVDRVQLRVRVQSGIRLKALNRFLAKRNMALNQLGSISEQSIAGATATGTHGSGINFRVLSSAIVAMRIVQGDGEVLELKENDERLDAFRVSVGALGIVSEITLQCSTAFSLCEDSLPMRFDDALNKLPELLRKNDHVKFWWFPHVDEMMVYRYKRVQDPPANRNRLLKWVEEKLVADYVFSFFLRIGNRFPEKIPAINRAISGLHLNHINRVGKSYELFNVPMPPKHRESEYAIPVEQTAAALRALRQMIDDNKLNVNFVVEVRFVKGDNYWLSPAYKRDSCYIGGYLYGDKRWPSYFDLFEKLMQQFNGRPHWGKEFTPALHDFKSLYEKWNDFLTLKTQADPEGVFRNGFMDKIFATN